MSLLSEIISWFFLPKVNRMAEKLKNSEEYIQLEKNKKKLQDELEKIRKNQIKIKEEQEELAIKAQKLGLNYKPGMNTWEIKAMFDSVYSKYEKKSSDK